MDNIKKNCIKKYICTQTFTANNNHTVKNFQNMKFDKKKYFFTKYTTNISLNILEKTKKRYSSNKDYCTLSKKTANIYIES